MGLPLTLTTLLVLLGSRPVQQAQQEWLSEPQPFARIAEHPTRFMDAPARAFLQFHSLEKSWNPYLTRFTEQNYVGVRAWSDEQLPWIEAEYLAPEVLIFVRRGSVLERLFAEARPHERYEVRCVVRELFAGRAWIEIVEAASTAESISEGSVLHAIRAAEFLDKKAFQLAAAEVERALAAPLPAHAWDALVEIKKQALREREKRRIR